MNTSLKVTSVDKHFVIVDQNDNFFARTYSGRDAKLIAAAPDLLAALNRILEQGYLNWADQTTQDMADAAVNKALGMA